MAAREQHALQLQDTHFPNLLPNRLSEAVLHKVVWPGAGQITGTSPKPKSARLRRVCEAKCHRKRSGGKQARRTIRSVGANQGAEPPNLVQCGGDDPMNGHEARGRRGSHIPFCVRCSAERSGRDRRRRLASKGASGPQPCAKEHSGEGNTTAKGSGGTADVAAKATHGRAAALYFWAEHAGGARVAILRSEVRPQKALSVEPRG
ncbi:hypothetical protein BD414DRAFT_75956 [Trametes punicea]|nr:hypothetical protein BD414DRAFT_75956 [Trametes punicea]